jgi:hypothetical protein
MLSNDSVDYSFLKVGNSRSHRFSITTKLATEKLNEGTVIDNNFGYASLAEMAVYWEEGTAEF